MEIPASLVKELREKTDAGMMDCKKALIETKGDINKAIDYLREKGLSKASKKADRIAAEGAIVLEVNEELSKASMIEINSETDFVAKNEHFQNLGNRTIKLVTQLNITNTNELYKANIDGMLFEEYLKTQIAKIGENIVVRRIASINVNKNSLVNAYLHSNGRVGTMIVLSYNNDASKNKLITLSKNLCMHAAAMKPQIISYEEFDINFIQNEKKALIAEIEKENEELKRLGKPLKKIPEFISKKELNADILKEKEEQFKDELKKQKKPEAIWDKIIPGLMDRFISDNTILDQRLTLLGQFFVMDDKKTIAQVINDISKEIGDDVKVLEYIRFELGEGVEKIEEDFAKEVASQMQ